MGNIDAWRKTLPGCEELRGHWKVGKRRSSGVSAQVSTQNLFRDESMLGLRAKQATKLSRAEVNSFRIFEGTWG